MFEYFTEDTIIGIGAISLSILFFVVICIGAREELKYGGFDRLPPY